MTKRVLLLTGLLLELGWPKPVQAQASAVAILLGIGSGAARGDFADKTISTGTYRSQRFPMRRTPVKELTGEAAENIGLLEAQLGLCHTALLADSTSITCPPERQAIIEAARRYIYHAQPAWPLKAYRQELSFYLAEDARRRQAALAAAPAN